MWNVRFLLSAIAVITLASVGMAQGTVDSSEGHLTIENPAQLIEDDIRSVYDKLLQRMTNGYGLADIEMAGRYNKWKRYNRSPYLSATHGNRYVNNYANGLARGYGKLKSGERFAAGTIFAKDSFTVTKKGKVFAGALFVMEKLAKGAGPETADWRYVMIMPDGSLFGDSSGETAAQMQYCHDCHRQKAEQDFVFFVPPAFQVPAP